MPEKWAKGFAIAHKVHVAAEEGLQLVAQPGHHSIRGVGNIYNNVNVAAFSVFSTDNGTEYAYSIDAISAPLVLWYAPNLVLQSFSVIAIIVSFFAFHDLMAQM